MQTVLFARRVMAAVALGLLLIATLPAAGSAQSFVPKDFDQLVAEAAPSSTRGVCGCRPA